MKKVLNGTNNEELTHYNKYAQELSDRRLKYINKQNERSKEWKSQLSKETRLVDIKKVDTVNVYGTSVSVYVSYCPFNCPNCFNKLIQDKHQGEPFTKELEDQVLEALRPTYIDNLCLVGGEPFLNAERLLELVIRVKKELPEKKIWSYTGFLVETLLEHSDKSMRSLLEQLDFLIDGQYIDEIRQEDLKNNTLKPFRGSSNQRLIDVQSTLRQGKVIELTTIEEIESFYNNHP